MRKLPNSDTAPYARVVISLPQAVATELDRAAIRNFETRSGLIRRLVVDALPGLALRDSDYSVAIGSTATVPIGHAASVLLGDRGMSR